MSWWGRLTGLGRRQDAALSRPRPDIALAIVGDIHGHADLLDRLLVKISQKAPDARLVFVGDYVDRGPDSRAVIDRLAGLAGAAICLRGNHEAMLLNFLDDPIENGGQWLRNGGTDTLASYGVTLDVAARTSDVLRARDDFRRALTSGCEEWLRALPVLWQSGNLLVSHAGPNPARSIDDQDERDFLWGHSRFLRDSRTDGIWVAHGHWIRDKPSCADGRIAVDTGAYTTGRLTAALIEPDGNVRFVSIR